MLRGAWILGGFALLGATLVVLTHSSTKQRIAANERAYLLRSLHEVVPDDLFDNDLLDDTTNVVDLEALGTDDPVTVYRARSGNEPIAALLTPVAPDGYSGPIRLTVGVYMDGTLSGVRVISHRETPGLGDGIEADRSDWIKQFEGLSLEDPPLEQWAVQRDGGAFDQFTGATITPRAVVKAVRNALIYFEENKTELFDGEEEASNE